MVAPRSPRAAPPLPRGAAARAARGPRCLRCARLPRSRDAGPATEPRARAAFEGLRDAARAPGRCIRADVPPPLARIRDEEAAGRRAAEDFPARELLPQWRARRDAPPGVHHARM